MDAILTYLKNHWIKFLVSLLMGFALVAIYLSAQGAWGNRYEYTNALFIAAGFLLGVGALSIINNFGGFNLASYYFRRKKMVEDGGKYEDFAEYSARKDEERRKTRWGFLPYIIVGLLYFIPSLVLMLVR